MTDMGKSGEAWPGETLIEQQQERVTERDWEVTCVWRWQVTLDIDLGSALLG